MIARRFASAFQLVTLAVVTLAVPVAPADLPHAIAVVDDVADRVMLFNPYSGEYQGDLVPGDSEHLSAPFDSELGPALDEGGAHYPDTILVSDLRQSAVVAFDATGGGFIKTLIASVNARGLTYAPDGRLLIAAGAAGILAYEPDGTFVETRVPAEPVDGPKNAWDVLVRPQADDGAGDMLVTDATLDVILRFDLDGNRLGVFAKLPAFNFVEQLGQRVNGHVLAVDVFGNALHEFQADGTWVRTIAVTRPRGAIELSSANLLVASEDGVQVFDGETGSLLDTKMAGYPATAPRYILHLRCGVPTLAGDMNGDGQLDGFDVDPFVLALTDPDQFAQDYPDVDPICAGDLNYDGALTGFDIDPFIALLLG